MPQYRMGAVGFDGPGKGTLRRRRVHGDRPVDTLQNHWGCRMVLSGGQLGLDSSPLLLTPGSAMKKSTVFFALAVLAAGSFPHSASAQTAEEEVVAVVSLMFDGMRTGDAELLKSLFHADALMTGTGIRDGSYRVSMSSPDGWIESISSFTGGRSTSGSTTRRWRCPARWRRSGPSTTSTSAVNSATAASMRSIWPSPTTGGRSCTLRTPA